MRTGSEHFDAYTKLEKNNRERSRRLDLDRRFWERAAVAVLRAGGNAIDAAEEADKMQAAWRQRFWDAAVQSPGKDHPSTDSSQGGQS